MVYENGIRQQNATVEVEHAPVSLGLLIEFGGRTPALNRELGRKSHELASIWWTSSLEEIDLQSGNMTTESRKSPTFRRTMRRSTPSSLSWYSRAVGDESIRRYYLHPGADATRDGRKAIVLISSGIDTLSKAGYDDLLRTAENSDTPIYLVSLAPVLSPFVEMEHATPLARIDWSKAQNQLQEIARASGGRAYAPENMIDLSATYDDMMENLKVRYVITYRSSSDGDLSIPRTVRVELVNPSNGEPLEIVDSNGKTIRAKVVVRKLHPQDYLRRVSLSGGPFSVTKGR